MTIDVSWNFRQTERLQSDRRNAQSLKHRSSTSSEAQYCTSLTYWWTVIGFGSWRVTDVCFHG